MFQPKRWVQRKESPKRVDLSELGRQIEPYWVVLHAIERPGFIMNDQVGVLLFSHFAKGTKVANDRLRRLFELGLVNAFRYGREGQGTPGGSSPIIYCLTREGAQLVASYRQVDISALSWYERQDLVSMQTILHRLDLVDLHCALTDYCRHHDQPTLPSFEYEPRYLLPKLKGFEDLKELRPDGLAEIDLPDGHVSLMIEVDRNTERPKKFAERIGRYEVFYRTGEWEKWTETPPTVLVVVSEGGRARVQALRQATAAALGEIQAKFARYRFATRMELYQVGRSDHGYTAPVWSAFDQPVCYRPFSDMTCPLFGPDRASEVVQ